MASAPPGRRLQVRPCSAAQWQVRPLPHDDDALTLSIRGPDFGSVVVCRLRFNVTCSLRTREPVHAYRCAGKRLSATGPGFLVGAFGARFPLAKRLIIQRQLPSFKSDFPLQGYAFTRFKLVKPDTRGNRG